MLPKAHADTTSRLRVGVPGSEFRKSGIPEKRKTGNPENGTSKWFTTWI
jgi:hypothetical protein